MKLKLKTARAALWSLVVMMISLIWSACDILEKDIDPDNPHIKIGETKVYIPTNGSAFINLNTLVQSGGAIQFSVASLPKKGNLDDLGKGLLQYSPGPAFTKGKDMFKFSIFSTSNKFLRQDSVIIIVESDSTLLPCSLYTVNDFVDDVHGPVTIDVLKNDILCGVANPLLSIFLPPLSGNAVVTDSTILYTPAPGFHGTDRILYKLTSQTDTTKRAYGQVIISTKSFRLTNDHYSFRLDTLTSGSFSLPVFQNDSLYYSPTTQYVATVISQPTHGTASINGTQSLGYVLSAPPSLLSDSLTYRVCKGSTCETAKVYIRIY